MDNKVLAKFKDTAVEKSIEPVVKELSSLPLLVAVKSPTPENLELTVATDNQGHLWIFVFTDQEELSNAFPEGSAFAEMGLGDILAMIGPDEQFGGIFVNSKSESMYLIPREYFTFAYQLINDTLK